jgi:hypothetical protein
MGGRFYLIFADIEGRLDVLCVECTKCAGKGRYSVRRLIEKYGRMTQNQIGSTEQRLALNVCYGIIGTVGIAILCRDLGVGPSVLPWVLYAIFAIPMIVMLSHRELFGALSSNRGILYAMIAVPAIYLLSRQTGFGG